MVYYASLLKSPWLVAAVIEVSLSFTIPHTFPNLLLPSIDNTRQSGLRISNQTLVQVPDNVGQFLPGCPVTNLSGYNPKVAQSPTLRANLFTANFLMHSWSTPMPVLFAISATPMAGQEQDGNVYFSSAKLSYLRIDGKVVEISTKAGAWGKWNQPGVVEGQKIPEAWDYFQLEDLNIPIPDAIDGIREAGFTNPWDHMLIIKQKVVDQRTLWFFQKDPPPFAVVMGDLERSPFAVSKGPSKTTDVANSECVLHGPRENAVDVT